MPPIEQIPDGAHGPLVHVVTAHRIVRVGVAVTGNDKSGDAGRQQMLDLQVQALVAELAVGGLPNFVADSLAPRLKSCS
jgi:hypothetical protein